MKKSEDNTDEPKNTESKEQKRIRERRENPTAKEKLQGMTFHLTKDLPDISLKREKEIGQIRQGKNSQQKGHSILNDAEMVVEKTNNHAREIFDSVVDFASGGNSREQGIKNVRQRKNERSKTIQVEL